MAEQLCGEWRKLCHFEDVECLEHAKRSLLTNSLLILDGTTQICEDIGRSFVHRQSLDCLQFFRQMLCYGRRMSPDEIEEKINVSFVSCWGKTLLMENYYLFVKDNFSQSTLIRYAELDVTITRINLLPIR